MSDSGRNGITKYTHMEDPEANALPVCYNHAGANGDENICYSSLEALSCTVDTWDSHDPVDMGALFSKSLSGENYIAYDVVILILSVLVLVMHALFSTKHSCFVSQTEGAFSNDSDSQKMRLACNVLIIVQASLMIVSSHSFSLMRVVSCGLDEKSSLGIRRLSSSSSENRFNSDICHTCDSNIRSIVFPRDFVVSSYATLAVLLAVACLCSAMYNTLYHNAEDNDDDDAEAIAEINNTEAADEGESQSFRYLARTLSGNMAARRYTASAARTGQRQTAAEVFQDHTAFKKRNEGKMLLWKFGYQACGIDSSKNGDDECAVCLEPLVSGPADAAGGRNAGRRLSSSSSRESSKGARGRARVVPFESGDASVPPAAESAGQWRHQAVAHCAVTGTDMAPVKLPCGHCFHERCICAWMRAHATCPICRADLETGRGGSE
jgi:ribosomal protein S27E